MALGLMACGVGGPLSCHTGAPWDWACELAAACCGLAWEPDAPEPPAEVLGGARFNSEDGRQPYHDREAQLGPETPFAAGLSHGDLLLRLRRLNARLEWDHRTEVDLPWPAWGTPALRAALWSGLYAGAHLRLVPAAAWDPAPFADFWD